MSKQQRSAARAAVGAAMVAIVVVAATPYRAAAAVETQSWVRPVVGVVVDGFRPPSHIGGAGNRGWEYSVAPGTVVHAAGAGTVAFAGSIGSNNYVSIDHRCGLRTTYSFVSTIGVRAGDPVALGDPIATASGTMHFGLRQGATYLDPALLFAGEGSASVRLVQVTIGGESRIR